MGYTLNGQGYHVVVGERREPFDDKQFTTVMGPRLNWRCRHSCGKYVEDTE